MDDIASFNQSRWDELAAKGVVFARPFLDLTPETAQQAVDPRLLLGSVSGKDVLCLASGGGQQSAAFHVLGAQVTVFDLSTTMLDLDRQAAEYYKAAIRIDQGDMRDLSRYPDGSFDVVWHAYSINFIPDPRPVFSEVARVLRPGGLYRMEFHNPFVIGMDEASWDGSGYRITTAYEEGAEMEEPLWEFEDAQGNLVKMRGPRAFRHTLSGVVNDLVGRGFVLLGLWEEVGKDESAAPGTWDHLLRFAPPWLTLWWVFKPELIPAQAGA